MHSDLLDCIELQVQLVSHFVSNSESTLSQKRDLFERVSISPIFKIDKARVVLLVIFVMGKEALTDNISPFD